MSYREPDPAKSFLGAGWSHPVLPDPSTGDVALALYEEDIRQALLLILETEPGERVMRPDFGAGLRSLVFEPLNTTTKALLRHRVEEALIRWEPRVDVIEVSVTADALTANRLDVDVQYRVRTTNTFYNLVFPFFLEEGKP